MGDHDDGAALFVELLQQLHHFLAMLRIEVAGGLVGEDEFRRVDDGARHRDALLLSARKLHREMLQAMAHVHLLQHCLHALLALRRWNFVVCEWQLHVFVDGQLVDEIEALEHEADVRLAQVGPLALGIIGHLLSEELVTAGAWVVDQPENVHQGGLAATRRSHQRDELSFASRRS